jgi:hypothetical protein
MDNSNPGQFIYTIIDGFSKTVVNETINEQYPMYKPHCSTISGVITDAFASDALVIDETLEDEEPFPGNILDFI